MGNDSISSVRIHYKENGQLQTKTLNFKGNFGFSLDGKKYSTKNGMVYNDKGKAVCAITMPRSMAYQFVGMSSNAESAYDLTYSEKDLNAAKHNHEVTYGSRQLKISGVPYADAQSASIIGRGAGKVVPGSTKYEDGVYSTQYKSKDNGRVSTVSVWLNE